MSKYRGVSSHPSRIAAVAMERGEGLLVEPLAASRSSGVLCVAEDLGSARERYRVSATKSDAFDAFVLADTLRHEHRHWRPLPVLSAHTAELQAVIRDRERINWRGRGWSFDAGILKPPAKHVLAAWRGPRSAAR